MHILWFAPEWWIDWHKHNQPHHQLLNENWTEQKIPSNFWVFFQASLHVKCHKHFYFDWNMVVDVVITEQYNYQSLTWMREKKNRHQHQHCVDLNDVRLKIMYCRDKRTIYLSTFERQIDKSTPHTSKPPNKYLIS